MSREQQVRDAVDRFVARVKLDTDARLQVLASELADIIGAAGAASNAAAAVELARAAERGTAQTRTLLIEGLVAAVRRLDEATTLHGILDALADGAGKAVSRAAVLLVDTGQLRAHCHQGYPQGLAPVEIPLDAAGDVAHAVALRQPVRIHPVSGRAPASAPPGFVPTAGRLGIVMPLVVAQQVVAVLHAEGPARHASEPAEPAWLSQIELLVRHAAARLESVTSLRMVEVLAAPVGS